MVLNKTGGLFRLAIKLTQEFSDNKKDFIPLVDLVGLYFQIMDDYVNLKSPKYMENKSFCEDLTEGKYSFPIIHHIRNTKDQQLTNILKQRTTDVEIKKHALRLMESTGSLEYTVKKIKELHSKVLAEIEKLGGNDYLTKLMNDLYSRLEGDKI
eukprot:TRINITY_DN40581_c0_g2_i1.p1 TRINITY_DN40581_c0_g2~~TRINITY_DN40581_c0_g2_i1.p1  ORF type:complete len:164 (-),score=25.53 TRINITY_DN40581_c0_g2_i1:111-572(-)